MTGKQAELITNLLQGITQQQMAITLNKSKSTISQLANAGRWPEIEKLLQQYKNMIEKLFPSL
jgi:transcriptional regulator with XRE-family HTH domain